MTQLPLHNKITELKVKAKSCTCVAIFQAATLNLECYALFPYSHTFLLVAVLHFILVTCSSPRLCKTTFSGLLFTCSFNFNYVSIQCCVVWSRAPLHCIYKIFMYCIWCISLPVGPIYLSIYLASYLAILLSIYLSS